MGNISLERDSKPCDLPQSLDFSLPHGFKRLDFSRCCPAWHWRIVFFLVWMAGVLSWSITRLNPLNNILLALRGFLWNQPIQGRFVVPTR